MTSKTLFRNLYKEECKRNLWIMLCIALLIFFVKPVFTMLQLDSWLASSYMTTEQIKALTKGLLSFSSASNSMVAAGLAIFLAIQSFYWLFIEKKVNLIHTIPLKREKLFFVYYCNGLLMFIIPFLAGTLLQLLTVAAKGMYDVDMLKTMMTAFLYTIIYFLVYYHVTILAVMLTGNILVCIAAAGTFIFYAPIIDDIITNYASCYLNTYYIDHDMFNPTLLRAFTSPLLFQLYIGVTNNLHKMLVVAVSFLISLVILLLSVMLYTRRKSESAGKPLSFPQLAPVIRILIVIPCALTGGLYIRSMSSDLSVIWYWFVLVFVGILAHCAMEVIFHFDFKAAFHHKIQLLLTLAVTAVIALSFQNDWFRYDNYLPKEENIASAAVYLSSFESSRNYYELNDDYYDNGITYISREDYLFQDMKLTELEPVLSLAKTGIEQSTVINEQIQQDNYDYDSFDFDQETQETVSYYSICYTMKSGRKIYRRYYANLNDVKDDAAKIYDNPQYQATINQLNTLATEDFLRNVKGVNHWNDTLFTLSGDQLQEFLDAYLKDLNAFTLEQKCSELPVMILTFGTNTYITVDGYYVYPDFTNTIALLQSYDIDISQLSETLKTQNIESITVSHYGSDNNATSVSYHKEDPAQDSKIQTLGSKLLVSDYIYSNPVISGSTSNLEIQVSYRLDNGILRDGNYSIRLADIPDFLKEDLRNAVK